MHHQESQRFGGIPAAAKWRPGDSLATVWRWSGDGPAAKSAATISGGACVTRTCMTKLPEALTASYGLRFRRDRCLRLRLDERSTVAALNARDFQRLGRYGRFTERTKTKLIRRRFLIINKVFFRLLNSIKATTH